MTSTQLSSAKIKKILFRKPIIITSFVLNGLFLLYVLAVEFILPPILEDKLFLAQLNAMQTYYCEDKYDEGLKRVSNSNDENRNNQLKMIYALTVCGKNFKNGQPLDLQPLVDQVNESEPKTDFKAN